MSPSKNLSPSRNLSPSKNLSPAQKDTAKGKEQPEALASFAAAARADGMKPADIGLMTTRKTAPLPEKLEKEHEAATKVLREGTLKSDEGAMAAVRDLKDRTRPR